MYEPRCASLRCERSTGPHSSISSRIARSSQSRMRCTGVPSGGRSSRAPVSRSRACTGARARRRSAATGRRAGAPSRRQPRRRRGPAARAWSRHSLERGPGRKARALPSPGQAQLHRQLLQSLRQPSVVHKHRLQLHPLGRGHPPRLRRSERRQRRVLGEPSDPDDNTDLDAPLPRRIRLRQLPGRDPQNSSHSSSGVSCRRRRRIPCCIDHTSWDRGGTASQDQVEKRPDLYRELRRKPSTWSRRDGARLAIARTCPGWPSWRRSSVAPIRGARAECQAASISRSPGSSEPVRAIAPSRADSPDWFSDGVSPSHHPTRSALGEPGPAAAELEIQRERGERLDPADRGQPRHRRAPSRRSNRG